MQKVKCANCGKDFELSHSYDEDLDRAVRCKNCHWEASIFCFDIVSEQPVQKPEESSKELRYEMGPGGMLVPYTELEEDSDDI